MIEPPKRHSTPLREAGSYPVPAHLDPAQQAVSFDQASKKRKADTQNRESGQGPTPAGQTTID